MTAATADNTYSTSWTPELVAATIPNSCTLEQSQTEGWISGETTAQCVLGTLSGTPVCVDRKVATTDSVASQIDVKGFGCALWKGYSKHRAIDGGGNWTLITGAAILPWLHAAPCPRKAYEELCGTYEDYDPASGQCIPYDTPIVIPVTRSQSVKLTDVGGGVHFDLNADGSPEATAWTAADSHLAFLAIDRNNNNTIDDGSELFGNHTVKGAENGFEALTMLNAHMGGPAQLPSIDSTQPIFSKLLLWEDRNHDGISEPDEVQPASNVVSEIGLGLQVTNRSDSFGNRLGFRGWALLRTGPGVNAPRSGAEDVQRQINIYDVVLTRK